VPELGQYLAIGEQVLIVYEDQVYEIVEGDGAAEVVLPQVVELGETAVAPEQSTDGSNPAPQVTPDLFENVEQSSPDNNNQTLLVWLIIGLAVVVIGVVLFVGRLVGKRP
jgi:hypothetical protein